LNILNPQLTALLNIIWCQFQLEKDLKNCNPKTDKKCIPELTKDEAMCKYGQSGNARGEACKRVKEGGGPLPGASQTKSLGGAYAM
jgi:hypothetical protein